MFLNIACENPKQERLARALFSRSRVDNRFTCVPHTEAYAWCPSDPSPGIDETAEPAQAGGNGARRILAGQSQGPTTRERLEMYAAFAGDLAVASAQQALQASGLENADITHLIVVTCTGFDAPGVDLELIKRLQLPATTQRIQVGFMGCHGAINGLRVARAITASDPRANVLLCAVELCSLHFRFTWDPESIIGNALFADGSASMVLAAGQTDSNESGWEVVDTGSIVIPDSGESMSWRIGDHGFEMRLAGDVGDKIETNLAQWFQAWLRERQLRLEDIDYWGVHPGGPRILSAVQAGLGLALDQLSTSRNILRRFGNMSSPTVLFILQEFLQHSHRLPTKRDSHAVLLGFGPGLVAEVALLLRQ